MSWGTAPIGEIFEVARGGSPRPIDDYITEDADGLNWVMISDATASGKVINFTKKRIRPEGLKKTRAVKPGDFILSNSMSFGRPYIMGIEGCIHDGWLLLRPRSDQVDPDYFYHLLGSQQVYAKFSSRASGATVKNLNSEIVRSVEIPLPPLEEQRRIAAILDQADALRRLRRHALDRLNALGQAIFHEMFGDPRTNPNGWPIGVIGDLLAEAKYGYSGKANSEGSGLPMLRMGNITYDGRIDLSDLKYIDLSESQFEKYTTKPGDILFNRTNSKDLVGKSAVIMQDVPMAIAGYLVRGRANERGDTQYISGYLNSPHGKAVLRNMCKNIVGMANINAKEFQSISIAMPPVELQRAYAGKLAKLMPEEERLRKSVSKIGDLFTSLQHRAFMGEL